MVVFLIRYLVNFFCPFFLKCKLPEMRVSQASILNEKIDQTLFLASHNVGYPALHYNVHSHTL